MKIGLPDSRLCSITAAVALAMSAPAAVAVENITFNGFMTVGATLSDESIDSENGNITDNIGFNQDTRVGVQVSAEVNPKVSITAQILGRAREDNYDAFFDWGFISYNINDELDIRAGKIKFPTFLISDYFEVGYAYPWIRPPAEVYNSNPITAITGADALFRVNVGNADILFQPYVGTSSDDEALVPQEALQFNDNQGAQRNPKLELTGNVQFVDFDAEDLWGLNVSASWDSFSVRAGYLETKVSQLDFGADQNAVEFISIGGTMDWNNVVGYAEYFEREIEGRANLAFPNQKGYYATLGYRIDKWLPHLTYAKLDDNDNPDPTGALKQDSIILGLRYELGAGADLKFEVQQSEPEDGSRGLFISDPGGEVTIYSIAVDVVF